MSTGQAAKLLGVHRRTVCRWADAGVLTVTLTPGGRRRLAESEVRALSQSRAVAASRATALP